MDLKIKWHLDTTNLASFGKFVSDKFSSINSEVREKCNDGVKTMEKVVIALSEKQDELKIARGTLCQGSTLMRGMAEKDTFFKEILEKIEQMNTRCKDALMGMTKTHERLIKLINGLKQPKVIHAQNRKKRNNKLKTKKSKRKTPLPMNEHAVKETWLH